MGDSPRYGSEFRPPVNGGVRLNKASMVVARRIIGDVVRGGLKPGDLLPPEKTMLDHYATGRGTLREALRLLEFQGVITLKPGPKGGPVLCDPDASHLSSTMVLLMQLKRVPFQVIAEFRMSVEPMISRMAAERISSEALSDLARTVSQMSSDLDDEQLFLEANERFHDVIAWSSGNAMFGYIIDSVLGIMDGTAVGIDYPVHRRKAILKAHEDILQALSRHDPEQAEAHMRDHVEAYVTYAQRKFPEVMGKVIRWDRLSS
jgi:GntR family transcriptional repressor for pyruvate dehydrogenase complex